jgi:hypothetical protein
VNPAVDQGLDYRTVTGVEIRKGAEAKSYRSCRLGKYFQIVPYCRGKGYKLISGLPGKSNIESYFNSGFQVKILYIDGFESLFSIII